MHDMYVKVRWIAFSIKFLCEIHCCGTVDNICFRVNICTDLTCYISVASRQLSNQSLPENKKQIDFLIRWTGGHFLQVGSRTEFNSANRAHTFKSLKQLIKMI